MEASRGGGAPGDRRERSEREERRSGHPSGAGDVPFRLLVESVEDYAIFMLDPGGRVVSWNRGAARIKGYSAEEVLGRHYSVFFTPEDRARDAPGDELARAAARGRVDEVGWRVRSDGSRFWASVAMTAIRDEGGELIGFGKVTRDLTERRSAEEERERLLAAEQEARRHATGILESITDAFFALDRAWRFTYVNNRAEELLRRPRHDLLGQEIWQVFPAAVGSRFEAMYRRAVTRQQAVDFEEYYPPLDRWFEVRAYPSPDGLAVYFHDVTDRRLAHEEVRERERQLRTVLDVLPLPVFIADVGGRITAVNEAVREFWGEGAPTPEHPGQYAEFKGWWPDTGRRLEGRDWALARAVERGEVVGPEEVEVETFGGERRTILNFARPIRDGSGAIAGAVAINVDITERKAHEEAERFLADAGRTLASSLDHELTLARVARLAVSRVADWCIVYVPAGDGVRRLAVKAKNRELEALAKELERRYPADRNHLVHRVFRTGEPLLLTDVPDELVAAAAQDEEHAALLRAIGFRSIVMVPLLARGEVLGAIAMGWAETGRRYGPDDLPFIERLAGQASMAVENARLYGEARRRAGEEAALRRAAAAVVRASTIEEVIQQIADRALEATDAQGAFVERIDLGRNRVTIVAVAGDAVPALGSDAEYAGSVSERVIERAEPILLENASITESAGLHEVARFCGPCSATAVPLADAGEPIGALILVRSLNEPPFSAGEAARAGTFAELASLAFRKIHLLEESESRREELERVTESRAALMRGFSHDLKNPLGAADGFLSLLADEVAGPLNDDQKHQVTRVRHLLRASLDIIDDLVELHRAEGGRMEIRRAPLDLRHAAAEVAEAYRPQADAKGLALEVRLPAELPLVESDASRVRQILGNLVSNAVKYTDAGGITVEVGQRDEDGLGCLAVDVADTGPGIPASQLHLLFREFSRLHAGGAGGAGGAGLGLAISQRVARALGGTIRVRSREGSGSTFTLLLPGGSTEG
jgi:PAS domain S-box-containing protein